MDRKFKCNFFLSPVLALALVTAADAVSAGEQPHSATQTWAKEWVSQVGPGISIAIAKGDVDPTFIASGNVSFADGAPTVDENTLWRMYSMTKPITALAAVALIEDGGLGLDDPVSKYFPEYAHMNVIKKDGLGRILIKDGQMQVEPAQNAITIRHLLTHTAGLGYSLPASLSYWPADELSIVYAFAGLNPWQVNRSFEEKPLLNLTYSRPVSLELFARRLATEPLLAEPGAMWSYSEGLDLLAAVIEKASGKPFETYVQDRLFKPLGIASAYWQVPMQDKSRLATMYDNNPKKRNVIDDGATSQWLRPPTFPYGGAGLVMSASDYDKIAHMLLNHGTLGNARVFKASSVDGIIMKDLLPDGVDKHLLKAMIKIDGELGFGAGGYVVLSTKSSNGRSVGTYGWGGAAGTEFWVDPVKKVRATGMINRLPASGAIDAPFIGAVYSDLAPPR